MAPDLFFSSTSFALKLPDDVCGAFLRVIEQSLEVVLPVGGRVSCRVLETGRSSSGGRGHSRRLVERESSRLGADKTENRGRTREAHREKRGRQWQAGTCARYRARPTRSVLSTRHGPPNAECKKKLVKTASERVARRSLLQHSRTARRGTLILRSPAPRGFASRLAGPSRFSEGGW